MYGYIPCHSVSLLINYNFSSMKPYSVFMYLCGHYAHLLYGKVVRALALDIQTDLAHLLLSSIYLRV